MQETPIATPPSGLTNGVDADHAAADSRDASRASSIERDTEDETAAAQAPAAAAAALGAAGTSAAAAQAGGKRASRRNGGHILNKKLKVSISKLNNDEEERGVVVGGGDQGKATAAAPCKPEIESESSNDASIFDLSAVVTRPIKTTLDAQALLQNGTDDLR